MAKYANLTTFPRCCSIKHPNKLDPFKPAIFHVISARHERGAIVLTTKAFNGTSAPHAQLATKHLFRRFGRGKYNFRI